MRFRATIENVPTFFHIIQAIEKLQKKFIIKFSETTMFLICNSDTNEGGIQVWSQIKVSSIFSNYRIQSNSNNEITMHLSSEALLSALKSACTNPSAGTSAGATANGAPTGGSFETEEVVVRLAKKGESPFLCFEISGLTRVGRTVRVAHDVRVDVMRPADVAKLAEPMCPEPDLHILLPPLHKMRTVVERLRPLANTLSVRANKHGVLQIGIHTEGVKVETEWRGCVVPDPHGDDQEGDEQVLKTGGDQANRGGSQVGNDEEETAPPDPDKLFTVYISIRSFLKFLNSHVVSTTTIACICQNYCLILYVYIGNVADAGGVLTFYVPAIIDSD